MHQLLGSQLENFALNLDAGHSCRATSCPQLVPAKGHSRLYIDYWNEVPSNKRNYSEDLHKINKKMGP